MLTGKSFPEFQKRLFPSCAWKSKTEPEFPIIQNLCLTIEQLLMKVARRCICTKEDSYNDEKV